MPDDNKNVDDDFFAELNADSATDDAPFTSVGSESASDDPFASLNDFSDASDPFSGESDSFGDSEASVAQEEEAAVAEVPVGKKGKKAKKEKAPKAPKVKKERAAKIKEPKAPKPRKEKAGKRPYVSSPAPFFFLEALLAALLAGANALAFMTAGSGASTYVIILDVLGLVILAVPMLLLSQLRKRPVGIFDVFMAFAAIFSVVSVLMIVTCQAKYFGTASTKVSATTTIVAPDAPETFVC